MSSQNNKQPMNRKSMTVMWVIIAAIMVFAAASDGDAIIPAVGTMVIVSAILIAVGASNKKAAQKAGQKPGQSRSDNTRLRPGHAEHPAGKPAFMTHKDEAEEAVSCHHATGKEKYIQQLDSYLKAGLIDKSEYKLMKERYQKLEIPEDYH